jgi:hypothetical protein
MPVILATSLDHWKTVILWRLRDRRWMLTFVLL